MARNALICALLLASCGGGASVGDYEGSTSAKGPSLPEQSAKGRASTRQATVQPAPSETTDSERSAPKRQVASGFGKLPWGATRQMVRDAYPGAKWLETERSIGYVGSVAGLAATTGFMFFDDALVRVVVFLEEKHTQKNLFLRDFSVLDDSLKEKYGQPDDDRHFFWRDRRYQEDVDNWGLALSMGSLAVFSHWEGSDTVIDHALKGDNYEVEHKVSYFSAAHEELLKNADRETRSNEL